METVIEDRLERITEIWNYFVWDYKNCSRKIKFDEDVKTNYFGDIIGYFLNTLDVIFSDKKRSNFTDKFSFTISFLQAIYVQQDLIQELLEIFKIKIDKGKLKEDPTYFKNREIRNELIGHPIRKNKILSGKVESRKCKFCGESDKKSKNKLALLSSTLFSNQEKEDEIQYLIYHRNNNFKFETRTVKIIDIQQRHGEFLYNYLEKILLKLQSIVNKHLSELDNLEKVIEKHDFITVLKLVELFFEAIFKSDFVYDKNSLLNIYGRRNEHIRYQNYIDKFIIDLKTAISEKRRIAKDIFESNAMNKSAFENYPVPKINFISPQNSFDKKRVTKKKTNIEIGKLATKRNPTDFNFYSGLLAAKCQENSLIISELEHMKNNINNLIEYYTSLRLISVELTKK